MSIIVQRTCDGCGVQGDSMEKLEEAPALDYCANCMIRARDFLASVDALHTQTASDWQIRLSLIREHFSDLKELPF